MIAPADYLDTTDNRLLGTYVQSGSVVDDALLPWADPYIAQLIQQHEVELAASLEQHSRRHIADPRVVPARSRSLVAVA